MKKSGPVAEGRTLVNQPGVRVEQRAEARLIARSDSLYSLRKRRACRHRSGSSIARIRSAATLRNTW
jgi:hypothetical protein